MDHVHNVVADHLVTTDGRLRLGHALLHPLKCRRLWLEANLDDRVAYVRLARTVSFCMKVPEATTLHEEVKTAVRLLESIPTIGVGDPIAAASCSMCLGSSNCMSCYRGLTLDETPCPQCRGNGACPICTKPS